jgi:hypothetical protein
LIVVQRARARHVRDLVAHQRDNHALTRAEQLAVQLHIGALENVEQRSSSLRASTLGGRSLWIAVRSRRAALRAGIDVERLRLELAIERDLEHEVSADAPRVTTAWRPTDAGPTCVGFSRVDAA